MSSSRTPTICQNRARSTSPSSSSDTRACRANSMAAAPCSDARSAASWQMSPVLMRTSEQIVVTAALKGRVIVQEMQLFRRRLSPKCNITAGEAPEFGNHVAMRERVGIVTAVFTKPFRDERHATILVGEMLRVHERKVKERT